MNREIKFKFIIQADNEKILSAPYTIDEILYAPPENVTEFLEECNCQFNESVNFCEGDCIRYENIEIVGNAQYTGLKDKNGVEIYEGDIYKGMDSKIFTTYMDFVKDIRDVKLKEYDSSKYEVIGNIYEHPNLLKDE